MKAVIAMDSFKGSLSSRQAGEAVREGLLRACPHAQAVVYPIADGGEGTADVLCSAMGCEIKELSVCGPLGERIRASYGIDRGRGLAIMEMSAAAGLTLVPPERRDPMVTTTYGVGEMIADAVKEGCRSFIMGIGGSATNDGGVGMLSALGFRFLDENGWDIPIGAGGLKELCRIEVGGALSEISGCNFTVACDVTNPLCGENGCSAVFAPQKGASPTDALQMDKWLKNYARLTKASFPYADENMAGAGAAGGLGFALSAYLCAELKSGVELILRETGIENEIRDADVVICGEGRIDGQTAMGKAPAGIASLAGRYGKRVVAFCGCMGEGAEDARRSGIDEIYVIDRGEASIEKAMITETAYKNLAYTAEKVFK